MYLFAAMDVYIGCICPVLILRSAQEGMVMSELIIPSTSKWKEWLCQLCRSNVHIIKKQKADRTCIGSAVN